ncbi:MAG: hypothetical protein Q4A34_01205 [Candidatus Saccharibacteria bacterium]|nr:hypothetical protein [Candidatus Saccharibacteria bacterium]
MTIDKHTIKRFTYRIRRDYLTPNNLVVAVAFFIALGWVWGSIEAMQRNYALQQSLDAKKQQVEVEKLRVTLLEYEGRYYQSYEYQELAARQRFGRGLPGERQLIVPSTDEATEQQPTTTPTEKTRSNFQQWMDFLFGKRRTPIAPTDT